MDFQVQWSLLGTFSSPHGLPVTAFPCPGFLTECSLVLLAPLHQQNVHGFLFAFLLYQAVKSFGPKNQSSSCIWHRQIQKRGDQVWAINLQGRLRGSPGGLLGEVEMCVMSSRWQCEHVTRPVEVTFSRGPGPVHLWGFCSSLKAGFQPFAAAKSRQSCPTLCYPIDGSPPGSPVLGILQARKLEWVAISFSNAWNWKVKVKSLSRVWLLPTPWTTAHQTPPSMGFSRQEFWSGFPALYPLPFKSLTNPKKVFASDNL